MTIVAVMDLLGCCQIPRHRTSASAWLRRAGIEIQSQKGRGGLIECVALADLPFEVRRAYELRQIEASGLPAGEYDDAAHDRLMAATPAMHAAALRKAKIARFLVLRGGSADTPLTGDLVAAVRSEFGGKGTDKMTLKRILRAVAEVDLINFAPALLPEYDRAGRPKTGISPEAWSFFMTAISKAAPTWPLRSAWKDVRDLANSQGWAWPPYKTVLRRWDALSEAQKRAARFGRDDAVNAMTMPVKRDLTSIRPMEWVSLDGRTLDFWVDFGDGKPVRPVMIALVDVASNYVLGYELARSENAVTTARLIRTVCQLYGIFDRLYTDNGSAFAGHLVAGGAKHKWRGKGKGKIGVKPLGVCYHLGIELIFAIPKNARAKIAERTFATLSRDIDDRPEFEAAHAGHAPGATPTKDITPVPLAVAEMIIRRQIDRHNREAGRKGQGANGRSYEQTFRDGLVERIFRKPTAKQLYLASLIYTPASVDRFGRVQIDNWTYGGPETQQYLLAWHGKGQILIGRDPDNFDAPAVAFDDQGRLICKDITPVKAGVYGSVQGSKEAAKNRKAARAAVTAADEANSYLDDAAFDAALARLSAPEAPTPPKPTKVVGGKFGGLQPKRKAEAEPRPGATTYLTPEMLERLDREIGLKPALGAGKSVR